MIGFAKVPGNLQSRKLGESSKQIVNEILDFRFKEQNSLRLRLGCKRQHEILTNWTCVRSSFEWWLLVLMKWRRHITFSHLQRGEEGGQDEWGRLRRRRVVKRWHIINTCKEWWNRGGMEKHISSFQPATKFGFQVALIPIKDMRITIYFKKVEGPGHKKRLFSA